MWLYCSIVPFGGGGVTMPKEGHSDPTEAQVSRTHYLISQKRMLTARTVTV